MYMYSVIELQTWADGSVHEIVVPDKGHDPDKTEKENLNDAHSEYHRILMYAAISANPKHGAVILRNDWEAGQRRRRAALPGAPGWTATTPSRTT